MDPITQAVLGAAAAQSVATRERTPWAGVLGGLAGMAPDLDVLIRSQDDPLLFLEYHRQFTHSLLFVPVGGLICAVVLFGLVRRRMSFLVAYLYCVVGYATHGLLDACTSYGTQLLWPFSDLRVAWNNVSVVDPLVTAPMLVLVILAGYRRAPWLARVACAWAVAYLLVGVVQRERAESLGHVIASQRGHAPVRLTVKPSFGNLLLWKIVYEAGDRYYVDAARMGWTPTPFAGRSIEKLARSRDLSWLTHGSQQEADLQRFSWFSDGFISLDPKRGDQVIDIRYSMVPNQIDGLWGIRLDPEGAVDDHAVFFTMREVRADQRAEITRMLFE